MLGRVVVAGLALAATGVVSSAFAQDKWVKIGTADADPTTLATTWSVRLPPEVTADGGLAVLRAGYARPVAIDVTA